MLIQFSGLPGTGKTTLAHHLAQTLHIPILSKDRIARVLRDNELTNGVTAHGYHLMFDFADQQLALGVSVILDAVFPMAGFRQVVRDLADKHDTPLYIIHTYHSDESRHKQYVEERVQYVPGWTPADWEKTLHVKGYYEAWEADDILRLGAKHPLQENIDAMMAYVNMG